MKLGLDKVSILINKFRKLFKRCSFIPRLLVHVHSQLMAFPSLMHTVCDIKYC